LGRKKRKKKIKGKAKKSKGGKGRLLSSILGCCVHFLKEKEKAQRKGEGLVAGGGK